MNDARTQLLGFLTRCRRRLLLLESGRALAWAVLAWLLAGLAGLLLRHELGGRSLRLLLAAGFTTGLVLALLLLLLAWWRRLRPEQLVRLLERSGRSGQSLELVAAWQFAREENPPGPGTSSELATVHVAMMAGAWSTSNPARLLPARLLRAPLLALAATALVSATLLVQHPQALGELVANLALAPTAEAAAQGLPWVGDISLHLHPPAYSGRSPRLVEGSDGSISALAGTRVVLEARADRPLSAGELRFGQGRVPLAIGPGRRLRAEFLVERPERYQFYLEAADGERWLEARAHPVVVEPDRPPEVRLLEPSRDLQVKPRQVLRLFYEAGDDFGLDQVRLVWRRAGGLEEGNRRVLKRPRGRRSLAGSADFDLAPLDLEPGERLQLYIEALDNDDVNGPKAGRSEVLQLEVFSHQKRHQELMRQVEQAWEQLLGHLASALEQEPEARGKQERQPVSVAEVGQLLDESRPLAASLRRLAENLADDPLALAGLAAALEQVGRDLEFLNRSLEYLLRRVRSQSHQPAGAPLRAHRAVRIARLESDVLYLEDLLDLARLDEIGRLAERIGRLRRRLAELLQRYARAPDGATRRQIEAEIARLKETIAALLERQRSVLKGVRDEYLNPEALAKLLDERDLLGTLDRLQGLLNQGRLDEALAQLDRLGGQLRDLQAALERSRQQLGAGRNAELARQLGRALAELEQISSAQRRLERQTAQLQKQLLRRWRERLRGKLDELWQGLLEKAHQVDRRLQKLAAPQRPGPTEQSEIQQARERVKLLELALRERDLSQSLQAAEQLVKHTSRLAEQAEMRRRFMEVLPDGQRRRDSAAEQRSRLAGQAARLAREIVEKLQRLVPDARRLLGGRQRRQLQQQARQQAELAGRLAQLQQQLQRLDQQAPLLGPPVLGRLARAGGHMQGAARHLHRGRPDSAQPRQRAALAELEALRQAMKKSCPAGGAGGLPLPLGSVGKAAGRDMGFAGGRPQDRNVELPGPDDFQPPQDYRHQLLEGMKDPVPDQYRQQVRDYYQELVK